MGGGTQVPGSEVFGDKKFTFGTLGRPGQDFYCGKITEKATQYGRGEKKNGSVVLGAGIMCEMKNFAICVGPIRV